ncbi:flagellar basal-body rod protein FlgC [Ancylobacter dichloromethanicus]|uniref:Flagellar basal-body rod protein FlgC n=1 Tax=Ancylobacter dichloromethanicus TaxID=518825 RepID=A0A9W6J3L7_9HYPH|nr:flagellar basal body rod protein FlgC [Ancylobacter dichloromethanicus]GLK70067.1 flagellar basal-body rod protein FlgC [Ancylobacter dichloromethanicus]
MIDALRSITSISGSGMQAQSLRMRVASENIANARSTGNSPGADPFRRKTIEFSAQTDRTTDMTRVAVRSLGVDRTTPFVIEHDPGNPAADASGDVKLPNVNMLVEMADLREAGRSYSANLQMMKQARSMISMTIDLLRAG